MRACQKCGAEVEKDDTYCPDCGAKIESVARKITVGTVLKIFVAIIFFIIFVNIFKNQPLVAILLLILFLIWTGILNTILKKLFNAKLSTGVKIIITAIVIGIFLIGGVGGVKQIQTPQIRQFEGKPLELKYTGEEDLYSFVEKINQIIEARDYNSLKIMIKEEMISPEVFEGLLKLLERRDNIQIILKPQDQRFYGNQAELMVTTVVESGSEKRRSGVSFFFEKTERGWLLFAIKPNLLDVKLERSFEEEAEYKIEKIPKPVAISKTDGVKVYT